MAAAFFVGLSVLLYPLLADYWNTRLLYGNIKDYESKLAGLDASETEALLARADQYNRDLADLVYPLVDYASIGDYQDTLNIMGTGLMGYITISRLDVEIPIYHGTGEKVLNFAAGHIEGTSLPVGGAGTHAAISAHRGLPSAKLFTDLDKLERGDTFVITVLDRKLTYEVDRIRIVFPDEMEDLAIADGKDYCTLVTCTPYGLNTHRLLVRGTRIQNARDPLYVTTQAYRIDSLLAAPAVAAPMLFVLLIYLTVRYSKKNRKRVRIEEIEYEEIKP